MMAISSAEATNCPNSPPGPHHMLTDFTTNVYIEYSKAYIEPGKQDSIEAILDYAKKEVQRHRQQLLTISDQRHRDSVQYMIDERENRIIPELECRVRESRNNRAAAPSGQAKAKPSKATRQSRTDSPGASANAVTRQQQSQFTKMISASKAEDSSASNKGRKKIILKQYPECLQAVDIKQDSTVKTMYWYAMQNICSEPLQIHWCEGQGCKPTTKAADLPAGGKERSWLDTKRSGSVSFHGSACATGYQGKKVYYDNKKNQCWLWE